MSDKPKTFTELTKKKQSEIKAKYCEGLTVLSIAEEYGLKRQSLSWYAKKHGWDEEKRLRRAELFQAFSDDKKAIFTSVYMKGSALLKRIMDDSIQEYNHNPRMPVQERMKLARAVSEVVEKLDKINRLDDGMPTEIKEERPFSVVEIKQKLKKDPFEIEEIEFTEERDNEEEH
jgi:hypothetical protein